MKYYGEHARAAWHGGEMADLAVQAGWKVSALAPVPLHRNQLRRRGYNQSEKLAREIANLLASDVLPCLERVRDTPSQTRLDASQRQINVQGAFRARDQVAGLDIVLVDDVATTGSTLVACATALLDAGARKVRALTIATDVITHP